jgi:hypothetical protein
MMFFLDPDPNPHSSYEHKVNADPKHCNLAMVFCFIYIRPDQLLHRSGFGVLDHRLEASMLHVSKIPLAIIPKIQRPNEHS